MEETPDCCWAYMSIIRAMEENPGLYTTDNIRTKIHERLCEHYKLTKEETKEITDHIPSEDYYGCDLHWDLMKIYNKKNKA